MEVGRRRVSLCSEFEWPCASRLRLCVIFIPAIEVRPFSRDAPPVRAFLSIDVRARADFSWHFEFRGYVTGCGRMLIPPYGLALSPSNNDGSRPDAHVRLFVASLSSIRLGLCLKSSRRILGVLYSKCRQEADGPVPRNKGPLGTSLPPRTSFRPACKPRPPGTERV